MDSFFLKIQFLILFIICFFYGMTSHAAVFDMGEHSGFIRGSDGSYSQVSSNGSIRSLTSNTALSISEKVNFQTSKGVFSTDLVRTALVDTARIGKTVRGLAVLGGPVGLTLTAASLVCDLTNICNQSGQWMLGSDPALEGYPQTTPNYQWSGYGGNYPNPQAACDAAVKVHYNGAYSASPTPYMGQDYYYSCGYKSSINTPIDGYTSRIAGCAPNYTLVSGQCVLQGVSESRIPTASDWDAKESLLNDSRFTPELFAKDQPIPVQAPSLPSPASVTIGKETKTTKDGSGNVTGTEESTTEAKIEQPSSGENPTGNPNLLKVSETTVTNTYNINNQLTGSTTTTSNPGAEQQPEPQSYKIDIDDMQDQPLETYQVPVNFAYDSWGGGSCPSDRTATYHYGTLNLSFKPACDFAIGISPVVLVISGIIAMYILAGVKTDA